MSYPASESKLTASHPTVPHPPRPYRRSPAAGGFTLVELLVVIGIIALLMSILLPTLGRVKEQANAVKCANNLRQISIGMVGYVNNEKGYFPLPAVVGVPRKDDVVFWQKTRDVEGSALSPYLGRPFNKSIWLCPTDDPLNRVRQNGGDPYPFSYVMNYFFRDLTVSPYRQIKMTSVVNPTEKWVFYEEDENTIDDCFGSPQPTAEINLLAIRHDRNRKFPDDVTTGLTLNGDRKGNAIFCDGHVEYISRNDFHMPIRYMPAQRI